MVVGAIVAYSYDFGRSQKRIEVSTIRRTMILFLMSEDLKRELKSAISALFSACPMNVTEDLKRELKFLVTRRVSQAPSLEDLKRELKYGTLRSVHCIRLRRRSQKRIEVTPE